MTQRLATHLDRFVVNLEDDGYDAYGVIQSYPLSSDRYVVVNLEDIDFLIEGLQNLKSELVASTALAK